ncbi:MAG: permease-like cell division protein FtsX [Candidatus Muiribacteriota bacterium]
MKLINDGAYFLKEALISFVRGGLMSVTSITIITISMGIFGLILIFSMNLNEFAQVLEGQVDVTIYLESEYEKEDYSALEDFLRKSGEVESFKFVSRDEALNILKEDLREEDFLLNVLDSNPLPDSIELRMKTALSVHSLITDLKKEFVIIDDIFYGQEIVENFNKITRVLRILGTVLVVLLGIASMFIVSNTIKLTVYARKDEIEIMKLVGATNGFIRFPFILEGIIQGFTGALLAVIIIGISYPQLVSNLKEILPFIPFVTDSAELFKLYAKLIFSGVFLGVIGSLISVRKFLDV